MSSHDPLVIMGGAFDPVHYGHLRTALEVRDCLRAGELRLIPSAKPPHRAPHVASGEQRLVMLRAAIAGLPRCSVDERELHRPGPSWTVDTLSELRAENGDRSLCIILGMDAFLGLTGWHRWEELIDLAHVVVAHRPGWVPPDKGVLGELLAKRATVSPGDLRRRPAGRILVKEVTQLEISSSAIRAMLAAGDDPRFLLPDAVREFIESSGCYGARSG
jgi:nicotinate-nucleotide adenylyltransferase